MLKIKLAENERRLLEEHVLLDGITCRIDSSSDGLTLIAEKDQFDLLRENAMQFIQAEGLNSDDSMNDSRKLAEGIVDKIYDAEPEA